MDDFSLYLRGEICALQLKLHEARSGLPKLAKKITRVVQGWLNGVVTSDKKLSDHDIS